MRTADQQTRWTRKGRARARKRSRRGKEKRKKEEKEASAVFCPWLPLLLLSANQLTPSARLIDRSSFWCFFLSAFAFLPPSILFISRVSPLSSVHHPSHSTKDNCLGLSVVCDAFCSVCPPVTICISRFSAPQPVSLRRQTSARCRFRISGDPLGA